MSIARSVALALSLVALLPTFASNAAEDAPSPTHDLSLFCLVFRERMFECRHQFADVFVSWWDPPPEQRERLRAKATATTTPVLTPSRPIAASSPDTTPSSTSNSARASITHHPSRSRGTSDLLSDVDQVVAGYAAGPEIRYGGPVDCYVADLAGWSLKSACPDVGHSSRRARRGSTRATRRAGRRLATKATIAISNKARVTVRGSYGSRP
jgi:hypothetical protein